jgi:hypothetical protein
MTVTQLVALIDKLYPNAISTDDKISYMNMAQAGLSPYFGLVCVDATVKTVVDQDEYSYPTGLTDASQILALDIATSATPTDRYQYTRYIKGNQDELYPGERCFFQTYSSVGVKKLGIYPIPSVVDLPIRIKYRKDLTLLLAASMSASPDFDARYHDMLAVYAVHMICTIGASSDPIQADIYMQKYNDALNEIWRQQMSEEGEYPSKRKDNAQWRTTR